MASRGGEKRGGSEGSPKPTVSAMRKTPSVGSQEDQLSLSWLGDWWFSDSFGWLSDSAGSDSEHLEGALDQPQQDHCLEDLCQFHRAARSGDVPGVERVLAPGDPGMNKRDRKKSLRHLIPECKMEQTPESLPQNNNPDTDRTSEVYLHEELQQDMQKFKNEVNTLEEEFLALKKETVQLQKEVEEEMEKHRSNRTELTGTLNDGATVGRDDDGLNQQIPRKENGEHDR
ncbi:hypothetical protein H8958_021798 [Nasalis larvatus]